MARKKVSRSLSPIAVVLPGFHGFASLENHSEVLLQTLRDVVLRVRGERPQPFYSVREVASFFRMPLADVARVYKKLDAEGLLVRLRGSVTLVRGRKMHPRTPIRGVVGLPIWLDGFLSLYDWRLFFMNLEEQLRQHNFIADFIFIRDDEFTNPSFIDRLTAHQLDYLLWFTPLPRDKESMLALSDGGVRVIVISDRGASFPGQQYLVSWQRAVGQGLAEWKRVGISSVDIPCGKNATAPQTPWLALELERAGLPYRLVERLDEDSAGYTSSLGTKPDVGVMFDDALLCMVLCNKAQLSMIELFKRARVMVTRSVNIHQALVQGVRVDMAFLDWDRIGRQVVGDLATGKVGSLTDPPVFEAKWLSRAPLSQFAQQF